MGTATTPTYLRGIVIPDARGGAASYDSTNSTATQAGNKPGVPEAQQPTKMVLEALGDMSAGKALRVLTTKGGMPGIDGARFIWYQSGDAAADRRYWDPPVLISHWEYLERTTTANRYRFPHMIRLASGELLAVWCYDTTGIRFWKRSTAKAWTNIGIPLASLTLATNAIPTYPCLVQLPSGRVLMFQWYDPPGASTLQVAGLYSDDDGDTWEVLGNSLLDSGLSTLTYSSSTGRLRAVYLDGRIALFGHVATATADKIAQWASLDLGASFQAVGSVFAGDTETVSTVTSGATNVGYPEPVVVNGQIHLYYLDQTSGGSASYVPRRKVLATAYTALADGEMTNLQSAADLMEWATESGGLFNSGDLAVYVDDDGVVWAIGRDHDGSAAMEVAVLYSLDSGDTFSRPGSSPAQCGGATLWRSADASTYPRQITACASFSQGVMLHCFAANPGTADDSACCAELGGYTKPRGSAFAPTVIDGNFDRNGDVLTWLPFDVPDDCGWTGATSGAPSVTSVTGGLRIVTAGGEGQVYTQAVTTTLAQGIRARAFLTVASGDNAVLDVRISDATPLQYRVQVWIEDGELRLYDVNAAADIGTVTTTAALDGLIEVLVILTSSDVAAYYRAIDGGSSRDWTTIDTGTPTSSAANDGGQVRWGNESSTDATWRMVAASYGTYKGTENAAQRCYGPDSVPVAFGMSARAVGGPTAQGEIWNIDTDYDFAVSNLDPRVQPSPRVPWRSTADNVQLDLIWTLSAEETRLRGPLMAFGWIGGNIGTAELYGQASGGGWTKIADLDARLGSSLKYTRVGEVIMPDTSGGSAAQWYLPHAAAAGMYFRSSSTVVRKIVRSSSGAWTPSSTTLNMRLEMEDHDSGDPSSGTTGEIWASDYLCVVPVSTTYKAYRLRILAQHTAENYYQLGTVILGSFHPFGRPYSWGRGQEISPVYEMTEGRTGLRRSRKTGPSRRAVEIAWPDGVDTSQIGDASSAPDYLAGYTGGGAVADRAVAAPAATAHDVFGILDEVGGATVPVVYLPRIALPASSSTAVHITHPEHLLYGRIMTETLRMDARLGNEWANPGEVVRVGTVRMERET